MRELIADGVAPAEAARQLLSAPAPAAPSAPDGEAHRLQAALEAYDEEAANAVLDRTLQRFSLDAFIGGVVLPAMKVIGRRWSRGEISVAQEHFASSVVRGRLVALARGWGSGMGPLAVLACPPGELHDIGLISFGSGAAQPGLAHHLPRARTRRWTRSPARPPPRPGGRSDRQRRVRRPDLERGGPSPSGVIGAPVDRGRRRAARRSQAA